MGYLKTSTHHKESAAHGSQSQRFIELAPLNGLKPGCMWAPWWELNCVVSSVMILTNWAGEITCSEMAFVWRIDLAVGRGFSILSAQQGVWIKHLSSAQAVGENMTPQNCSPLFSSSPTVKINFPSNAGFYGNFFLLLTPSTCPPPGRAIYVVWSGDEFFDDISTHNCEKPAPVWGWLDLLCAFILERHTVQWDTDTLHTLWQKKPDLLPPVQIPFLLFAWLDIPNITVLLLIKHRSICCGNIALLRRVKESDDSTKHIGQYSTHYFTKYCIHLTWWLSYVLCCRVANHRDHNWLVSGQVIRKSWFGVSDFRIRNIITTARLLLNKAPCTETVIPTCTQIRLTAGWWQCSHLFRSTLIQHPPSLHKVGESIYLAASDLHWFSSQSG